MKKQILLALTLVFLVFCLGSTAIIYNLLRSTTSLRNLINLHEIEDIRQNLNLRVQKVQSFVHLSALDFSYNLDEVIANINSLDGAIHDCYACHQADGITKEISYAEELLNDYQAKLSSLITSGRDDEWRKANQQQAIKIAEAITFHVQDMVNRAAASLQRKTDLAMGQIKRTYYFLAATLISSLVIMAIIARLLSRNILSRVDQLLLATNKLSAGELGYVTEDRGNDEFSQLQRNFNAMSLSLAEKERENAILTQDLQRKIDELHTTQNQLVISEKLASIGLLAGGIAHDFNNIFCGVQGYIHLLKLQIQEDKSATATLLTLDKAIQHASQLVGKLKAFAGHRELHPQPVDINALIGDVHKELTRASTKAVEIELHLDGGLAKVQGNAAWLRELLWDVCENALEAIPDPGRIVLATENVPGGDIPGLSQATGQAYVHLSVRDNGIGIKDQDLGKIFDPYFSTRELYSRRGLGLGMAIAFSIVKQHHGQIVVASREGGGTQVDIYLPAEAREDTTA